ncbi:A-kinase anchor protein 8-like [Neoarius graeffei]|uniref:A-kinase anchor protein 8-like n=1 Tax=Neoarius graeffei TaxID=443677 RepID=UPI00298C1792|nr:A-kinase anchor protein 8-like [Neoarius graeffei]
MAASRSGSGTGNRDTFNCPESVSPHSSMKTSTGDVITKIDQQINILKEGAKSEGSCSDRSEQRESTKPQVVCHRYPFGPDDFVNDEMSILGSIDFVALGRIRDRNRGADSGSANKGWRSQHHGRWSGQKHFRYRNDSYPVHGRDGQNGGYCAYPESGSYPPHHGVHDRPDWHFKGGQGASFERPFSQGSATRQGPDFHMEYNPNPVGGAQRPLSPPRNLGVHPVSIGRKKANTKSRKRHKKALQAAARAQANQNRHAVVTVKNTADSTTWRASNTGAEGQSNDAASHAEGSGEALTSASASKSSAEGQAVKITAQRMAFVCPVCKFRSFYRKNLDAHLASEFHKDHFKFLSERLSQPTVDFLQRGFSRKYEKIEDFISQIPNHREAICQVYEEQDLTRDLSMGNFMRRAEAAHCLACNIYIPMDVRVIKKHLRSIDHNHYCQVMMEHSKKLGLSVAQHLLRSKDMHRALRRYLREHGVTDVPEMNPEKASSAGQTGVPDAEDGMIRQETEPVCDQMSQDAEAEGDGNDEEAEPFSEQDTEAEGAGHDKEVELFCEQMIQDAEAEGDGSDEEAEPFSEQDAEAEGDGNDEEAEPFCEQDAEAEGDGSDEEAEPFSEQDAEAEGDGNDEEAEPFCEQDAEAEGDGSDEEAEAEGDGNDEEAEPFSEQEAEGDGSDEEAEPFCEQDTEAKGDGSDEEAEPFSEQDAEAEGDGKDQEAELLSVGVVPAAEQMSSEAVQEEAEEHDPPESLFDLLDEEDDMEGVELGEEEMEEEDYV